VDADLFKLLEVAQMRPEVDVLFWGQTIQSFEESCEVRRLLKTQVNRRSFGELPAGNLFGCCTCSCFVQPSFRRASEQQESAAVIF
jgi:hypothetical protein